MLRSPRRNKNTPLHLAYTRPIPVSCVLWKKTRRRPMSQRKRRQKMAGLRIVRLRMARLRVARLRTDQAPNHSTPPRILAILLMIGQPMKSWHGRKTNLLATESSLAPSISNCWHGRPALLMRTGSSFRQCAICQPIYRPLCLTFAGLLGCVDSVTVAGLFYRNPQRGKDCHLT